MEKLTLEEQACNYETMKHIQLVQHSINILVKHLLDRGEKHDLSKLQDPEVQAFTEHTPKLSKLVYNSPEYLDQLKQFQSALDHHYANNRHHPEHHFLGIRGMNLVDVVEMFCDWFASSKRQNDGNLHLSIKKGADRFKMSDDLKCIFENTVELLE